MKIGIVTDPYLADRGTSMSRYTKNLIENLLKINKEHEIYLIHSKKSNNPLYSNQHELLIPEIPLLLPYGIRTFHLPFLLRRHNFDVVHYPTGMPFFSWIAGSKNIKTLHSVASLIVPLFYPKISRFTWLVKKFDYKKMESIIAVSESEKNNIVRTLKIPRKK